MVRLPHGPALVQTVDFFTPIVNDPYHFGRIAAANSLSDIYAMGGEPYTAMNVVCFPIRTQPTEVLLAILQGGQDAIEEADAILTGGHSVEDQELKYGLAVTGLVDPSAFATNGGARPGDQLLLTKPLGIGVLATAIKANLPTANRIEEELIHWAGRLNRQAGRCISLMRLRGATDITGFGLGGHLLEMARASNINLELWLDAIPFLDMALELTKMGMLCSGSFANKQFYSHAVGPTLGLDALRLDLIFDTQTSGGLVLAVPEARLKEAQTRLLNGGDLAAHIGQALPYATDRPRLMIS
ncbi:Selenide, water dikinase [Desulfovibrionales bacterium]